MFNRKSMTQKEMEKLADIVVTKLIMVMTQINNPIDMEEQSMLREIIMQGSEHEISEEEMLMGELARLQTILMIYEDKDTVAGYEKAAIIATKIKRIQYKLNQE
tara:strand:- start:237 stop:548 length:312 start_codon:yes stop_codon:yes gene_type:complete